MLCSAYHRAEDLPNGFGGTGPLRLASIEPGDDRFDGYRWRQARSPRRPRRIGDLVLEMCAMSTTAGELLASAPVDGFAR